MITFRKFYFESNSDAKAPSRTVSFDKGINIILGEESEKQKNNRKMNSVGKSLLIESLNFCLLKKSDKSRVMKIPDIDLDPRIYFCLDIDIDDKSKVRNLTVKRNRANPDKVTFVLDGSESVMDSFTESKKYLEHLFFSTLDNVIGYPSLRSLLSILIREEDSLYKDILKPYHNNQVSHEDLLKPHLFLFNVDLSVLTEIKAINDKISNISNTITELKSDFTRRGIPEKNVSSYINELSGNVEKLTFAIDALKPSEAMQQKQTRIKDLEAKLEKLASERASKVYLRDKIKTLPEYEKVDLKQVQQIFNHYKDGLGDHIKKSFQEVYEFKKSIDDFQSSLMNEKLIELNKEISKIDEELERLDSEVSQIYEGIKAREQLSSLKEAVRVHHEKDGLLRDLSSTYKLLEAKKDEKIKLVRRRQEKADVLSALIFDINKSITEFEDDLKKIHQYIAENQHCQFDIEVKETPTATEVVKFDYSINLQGGSGMNRVKVFIYDVLLLTSNVTRSRHFGFLIHDNIFPSAGRDDMVKGLNYLNTLSKSKDFQYIVTLNKDEFESQIDQFNFDYKEVTRVELTRDKPLIAEYSEIT